MGSPSERSSLRTLLLVFLAAVAVYADSVRGGFVWDDHLLIEGEPFQKDPANAKVLLSPEYYRKVHPVEGGARPVFLLSLLSDRALWGENPSGYRLTNVLLHGAASSLVAYATPVLLPGGPPAWLAGLLFALHPIHTEAVDLPSFRPDILATIFVLLALLTYARMQESRSAPLLAASAGSYLLALLSKEMAVTFPLLALGSDLLLRRRADRRTWAWRLAALALYGALTFWYLGFRAPRSGYRALAGAPAASAPAADPAAPPELRTAFAPSAPPWQAIYSDRKANALTMSAVAADYFRLLAVPYPLRADRAPRLITSLAQPRLWLSWLTLAALLAAAAWALRRGVLPVGFGLAWCFAALLPVLNIVPIYNPFAERYLYLVSVGACWALAWALARRPALALLVLATYAALTARRGRDWRSDEALFGREAALEDASARTRYNLGAAAREAGDFKKAEAEYRAALALHPGYVEALTNLGLLLAARERPEEALEFLRRAVALKPRNALPYDALGRILDERKDFAEAERAYRAGLALDPGHTTSWMHLAKSLANAGRLDEALTALWEAEAHDPKAAKDAAYNRGMIFDAKGDFSSAAAELRKVLAIDPKHRDARMNLGVALHHKGDHAAALRELESARKLAPRYAPIYYNLAVVHTDGRELGEAERLLREALRLDPDYADALYNLAILDHQAGRLDEAVKGYEKTLARVPGKLEALNNLGGIHEQRGELAKAKMYHLRALKVDPSRPSVHNNLGNVYLKEGATEKAVAEYQEALRASFAYGDPPASRSRTLANLGMCYQRLGRVEEALSAWRQAAAADPGFLNPRLALGRAYRALGRREDAAAAWREVLALDPRNAEAAAELSR